MPTPRCKTRVILGPPGTGKTSRLIRVAQELCDEQDQQSALFVSHTTAAAKELGRRCGMELAEARTLHSACYNMLGLTNAQVVDDAKLRGFGRLLGLSFDDDQWPREALGVLAMAECTQVELAEAYANSSRPCGWSDLVYVTDAYTRWKRQNGFIDFTDMLTRCAALKPQSRWSKLFIDEAQDFSPVAWQLIEHMADSADVVAVAGDDDQAIFEWSGADAHGVDAFINKFGSEVDQLDQSWRVPIAAHALAQKIAGRIRRRIPKIYRPTDVAGEHHYVTAFDALRADDLRGATVLYRDKSVRGAIEEHMRNLGLRYTGGRSVAPYDRREARALRIIAKLRGGSITAKEMKTLRSTLTPYSVERLDAQGVAGLDGLRVYSMFDAPPDILEYYERVDVTLPPEVRLSTIHMFKGAEDDRIVLCTGMSERTAAGRASAPDSEHRVWYVGVTRTKDQLMVVGGDNEYDL